MPIQVKHKFTSPKGDGPDTSLIQPTNWNDSHDFMMDSARLLGRTTIGNGSVEQISIGAGLALNQGTLANPFALAIGVIADFPKDPPTGWLHCMGQLVSRVTYSALFAYLGTTFGAGDGTTTFGLPDIAGRVRAGFNHGKSRILTNVAHGGGVDGNTIGAVGGEYFHVVTEPQMPHHNHYGEGRTSHEGAHSHEYLRRSTFDGNTSGSGNIWKFDAAARTSHEGDHSHSYAFNTNHKGGNVAHNNVQPTIIVYPCIFAGV